MPLLPARAVSTSTRTFTQEVEFKSPAYLRIANLVIPGVVINFGIFALLVKVGVISAALLTAPIFGYILLGSMAVLAAVGWFGPMLVHGIGRLIRGKEYRAANQHDPRNQYLFELTRRYDAPSTMSAFDWTLRITLAATGFALVGILIAMIIFNPAGAMLGTAALELIALNPIPFALAGAAGTLFGVLVGAVWRRVALDLRLRIADKEQSGPQQTNEISITELKFKNKELERRPYYATKHDLAAFVRIAGGAAAGVAVATLVSLFLMPSGGLGALPFALIGLGFTAVAFAYPFIARGLERAFAINRKLVEAEKDQPRYWFAKSSMDLPFYLRIFLGVASGLAIGGVLGGPAILIAPFVLGGVSLALPFLFAPLEHKFGRFGSFIGWLQDKGKAKGSLFAETPHQTADIHVLLRLFNGATAGAILCTALMALGLSPSLGIAVGITISACSVLSPFLSALIRQIPMPQKLRKWFFSPHIDSRHTKKTREGNKMLKDNKFLAYAQWYVRLVIGALVGGLIGMGLSFFVMSPVAAPLAVASTAIFFLVAQPIYKRAQKLYDKRQKTLAHLKANAPRVIDWPLSSQGRATTFKNPAYSRDNVGLFAPSNQAKAVKQPSSLIELGDQNGGTGAMPQLDDSESPIGSLPNSPNFLHRG